MLDSELIDRFMRNFYGYGNLQAPIWFVGMEEAGGQSEPEIADRLAAWSGGGEKPAVDLARFHIEIGMGGLFHGAPPVQATWRQLMRFALSMRSEPHDKEALRAYQTTRLGSESGEVALIELLPLPKPSLSSWPYRDWLDAESFPWSESIREYEKALLPIRKKGIRELILERKPSVVVFYGARYRKHWEDISGCALQGADYPIQARAGVTLFLMLPHPVARGKITAKYLVASEMARNWIEQ